MSGDGTHGAGRGRGGRPRRRVLQRVPIRLALVTVVLIPTVALVALTANVVSAGWSNREAATRVAAETDTLEQTTDALAKVTREGAYTAVVVTARALGVDPVELDRILHVDYAPDLVAARRAVDADPTITRDPTLRADLAALETLRTRIDAGTATAAAATAVFDRFEGALEARWNRELTSVLAQSSSASLPATFRTRLDMLDDAYLLSTAGIARVVFASGLLGPDASTAERLGLTEATARFDAAAQGFDGQLGPDAAAAYRAFLRDPQSHEFDETLATAGELAVSGQSSPDVGNAQAYGQAVTTGVTWLNSLTTVVTAAGDDLSALAHEDQASATSSFVLHATVAFAVTLVALVLAFVVAGAVTRPLRRMSAAAETVHEGSLDVGPVEVGGPREVADTVAAFNDMTATLREVEGYALTLAGDHNAAHAPVELPGPTGRALHAALDRLRVSIHAAEVHRAQLEDLATHDALTGLANRRAALELIARDRIRIERSDEVLFLLFIDLDDLKLLNDSFGHEVGDAALRATAGALREATRQTDTVARFGGDEFTISGVVGPEDSHGEVTALAQRIRAAIHVVRVGPEGSTVPLRCSIGIAATVAHGCGVDELVHRADAAMYAAKHRGRDQYSWHEELDLPDRVRRPTS